MLTTEALCDLPLAYSPSTFRVKWADSAWEIAQARRLRRDVFCTEQGVFENDDLDALETTLQSHGVTFISPRIVRLDGGGWQRGLMVKDPDGHPVLLVE